MVTHASRKFPSNSEKPIISNTRGFTQRQINVRLGRGAPHPHTPPPIHNGPFLSDHDPKMTALRFGWPPCWDSGGPQPRLTSPPALQISPKSHLRPLPATPPGSTGSFPETSRGPREDNHRTLFCRFLARFWKNGPKRGVRGKFPGRLPPDSEKNPRKLPPQTILAPDQVLLHLLCVEKIALSSPVHGGPARSKWASSCHPRHWCTPNFMPAKISVTALGR